VPLSVYGLHVADPLTEKEEKMKDYSVTVKDNQDRVAVLAICGQSVVEGMESTGLSLAVVCEQLESSAFWKAVENGEVNARAVWVDSVDHPLY
jgi:uncharacterized protein (DUF1786 family)